VPASACRLLTGFAPVFGSSFLFPPYCAHDRQVVSHRTGHGNGCREKLKNSVSKTSAKGLALLCVLLKY